MGQKFNQFDIFHALAEPRRRDILEMLASSGTLPASAICEKFKVSSAAISQHLKVLRQAQLVVMEKRGQQRIYQINTNSFSQLEDWLSKMTKLWTRRFDAMDKILAIKQSKIISKG
jgi:DNA-binding transcriptional ArsR family regulator